MKKLPGIEAARSYATGEWRQLVGLSGVFGRVPAHQDNNHQAMLASQAGRNPSVSAESASHV